MKHKENRTLKSRRWWIMPIVALVTFGITNIFSHKPQLTESLYSNGLYPVITKIVSAISNLVAFSISDLFYLLLIILVVALLLLTVFRRIKLLRMLLILVNVIAGAYILFNWLWGFNYYRAPFNERLSIQHSAADTEEFMAVFEEIIEQANQLQPAANEIPNASQIDSLIESSYARYADFLQISYPMGNRRPKQISLSGFFAKAGISGYFGPFFNELHINKHLHQLEYPVVLAHEKAHQFGITSEAETSFYAWFACSYSQSDYLRYTASLYILRYFLNAGHTLEGFQDRVKNISAPVRADLIAIRDHWLAMRHEKIDQVASRANDAYLRSNRVEAGIEDYTGVVALVMDFSLDGEMYKSL